MSAFSDSELAYLLGARRLGRLATVGADGTPHVVPVGWSYNREHDSIDIGGHDFDDDQQIDVAAAGEVVAEGQRTV